MKTKYLTFLLSLIVCTSLLCSCSDDDEPEIGQGDDPEEVLLDPNYERAAEVAMMLFEADLSETVTTAPEPVNGIALSLATPNYYSVGLNSAQEAMQWFVTYCVPYSEREEISATQQSEYQLDFGEYGSVVYQVQNNASCYGIVSVELPGIAVKKQFELIPMELWPENDSSLFYRGNIVKDNYDGGTLFMCIRACEGSQGLLLSFSTKWHAEEYNYINYEDWWKGKFRLPRGMPEEAWVAYAQMYSGNEENFRAYIRHAQSTVPGFDFLYSAWAVYALVDEKEEGSYRYVVGDPSGGKHWWMFRWVYKLTQKYIYIGKNELQQNGPWSLPTFRMEEANTVDKDYWWHESFCQKGKVVRFVNNQENEERFTLVLDTQL